MRDRSLRARPPRSLAFARTLLFLVAAACGGGEAATGAARDTSPPGASRAAADAHAPGGQADAGADAGITCQGTLLGPAGEPVVGRPLVVVDARGKRWDLMSDEAGVFHAMGVVAPYDVAIAPAPSGTVVVPVVYLGLTGDAPTFRLQEDDGTPPAESQVLSVSVDAPPCASGPCWVSVVSASASGSGSSSRAFSAGASFVTVDVPHAWRASSVPESEEIDVHVLVGDDAAETFAYAHVVEITASPGDWTNVDVTATAVPASSPVAIHVAAPDVPAGWERSFGLRLDLAGGTTLDVRRGPAGPTTSLRLPLVPNAIGRAVSWATEPAAARAHAHVLSWSSLAWSAPIPPGASRVDLAASRGAVVTSPGVDGGISRRGRGVAWTSPPGSVITASLHDIASDRDVVRVHTAGSEVAWRRLARLGLEPPQLGVHVLELETRGEGTTDDLVAAAPLVSPPPGGWTARHRRRIVVTP